MKRIKVIDKYMSDEYSLTQQEIIELANDKSKELELEQTFTEIGGAVEFLNQEEYSIELVTKIN